MDRRPGGQQRPLDMEQFRRIAQSGALAAPNAPEMGQIAPEMGQSDTLPVRLELNPIGPEQIAKAMLTLNKYKAGKAMTEARIVASETWWKRRHWEYMEGMGNPYDHQPASAWLFNCVMSKHADAVEAFPAPNILPREVNDKDEAKKLSAIVPVVLEQNDYEETYSDGAWQKLKQGTRIEGVFWDPTKHNGLGDISVRVIDALNIYPEPGIRDIQKCRNVFTVELVDVEVLREMYPDKLAERAITGKALEPRKYVYDDNLDTTDKAVVVDWYYKKRQNGREVLHYCKFVDETILFASENEPAMRDKGLYEHGMYPFIFDPLFPIEGSIFGYGYIDVGKDAQETIDRMNQALEKNVLMGAQPRFFVRQGGDVNEREYADWRLPYVHVQSGTLGEDSIRQIKVDPLNAIYANMLQMKIEELKETTGNRDASNGGTSAGVTAASAIAAMQEQAGKTSRASTRSAYRAYARMVNMVIELIRQFYDLPRQFRIVGTSGEEEFATLDNSGLKPQHQGVVAGEDMGYRKPVFDVEVSTQKMTAYTKLAQNEMALQMYQLGVLDPMNSDKALALLDIMDFDHKDLIEEKVRRNGTMYQLLVQYQQIALALAQESGRGDIAEGLAQTILGTQQGLGVQTQPGEFQSEMAGKNSDSVEGLKPDEHAYVENSRRRTQASTIPGGG